MARRVQENRKVVKMEQNAVTIKTQVELSF